MISILVAAAFASSQPALREELEPLRFLLGHCWRGSFPSGEVDVHCFEPMFEGQHVRDRHEVSGGARPYRGETIFSWDSAANAVAFTYWNISGGVSRGTMTIEPDRLRFADEQYRGPNGETASISTHWRRTNADSYEAVSTSDNPSLSRTVRFERLPDTVPSRPRASQAGSATPIAVTQTRAPDGSWTLLHETLVDAPVADVWNAISTAEGWLSWAVPLAWSNGPNEIETSYRDGAVPGDPSTIRQAILATVPGRMIAFRTLKAPQGFPDFDIFSQTTAVIELEAEGELQTRVRIVGAGYPDTEAGRRLIGYFREGNRISLDRLRSRFIDGPMDWTKLRSQPAN